MGEPVTTTGSIDAKLTIDKSDWDRKVAEAKAEARELGGMSPSVSVDANVGAALAKLDAVMMAEKRLEAAQRSKLNTSGALSVAEMRYEAVMTKSGRTDLQVAAAEEALARARRTDIAATEKAALATMALNAAKSDAAKKSLEEAAADDVVAESSKRASLGHRQNISAIGALIALSPAILAAAAPVGAAAVGLGAAFGVMGVSGVLAIKGIKDAMEVGDTVGNTYAAGLGSLKGDLNALAGTSANAMLAGFNQSVGDINARMPFLTSMVSSASGQLSQMGGIALRGVLDGLQTMNPLLQSGGVELSKFVSWLFSFNGTSSFQSFISYAIDNLPATTHLLENLVTTAGHILAAYAPLGPVMLSFLNGLTDGLNALPLPVLAGLVASSTLLGPALRMAFAPGVSALIISVAEAIGFTGVMANLAVPVVGILTAVLAGAAAMSVTSALATNEHADATKNATLAAQNYAQALQQDNDAIGENVRRTAAKALQDSGATDAAKTLGISIGTLTDAATGNSAAMKDVQAKMTAVAGAWGDSIANGQKVPKVLQDQFDAMQKLYPALGLQADALGAAKAKQDELSEASRGQTSASAALAAQYGTTVAALQSAQAAEDKQGQSTADTTIKMQLQNNAAGILKMTLDGLNGKAISAAQAQNAFDSSLANMGTHVDKTGKQITFTTTSINDMSAASVALRGQLNGQVANLENVVQANGGLNESTGKAKAEMEKMRQQIIDNAVAHGVDKDAVTAYVDGLLKIPKSIPPTKLDVDNAAANAKIADTQWRLDQLQSKRIFIDVQQSTSNVDNTGGAGHVQPVKYNAEGGPVSYLDRGGFPGGPKGTDTVPTWLTPEEFVVKRASAKSIGLGNLDYMNRTGQLPPGSTSQPAVHVSVVVENPFTAEEVQARVKSVAVKAASAALGAANRDAGRRPVR